jgi:beta-glucosidase/6-phospho-beta-glucosidase/beta-galactosidase
VQVKRWITISDPHSISYGYSDPQSFAPGVNGTAVGYYLAAHTLIQAHARVYRIYDDEFRSIQQGNKGTIASNNVGKVIKMNSKI